MRELSIGFLFLVVGLLTWHGIWLKNCRTDHEDGVLGMAPFVKHECPINGPYGPDDDIIRYIAQEAFSR